MFSATLLFVALALLCAAGALLLWQRGAQREERASTERFIDSRMAPTVPGAPTQGVPRRCGKQQQPMAVWRRTLLMLARVRACNGPT